MQRIDGPTRAATLPAPAAVGTGGSSPGFFANGDPLTSTPPTTVTADWANTVQEELAHVIETAGITLDKTSHVQLLAALSVLFVGTGGGSGVHIGTNQVSLPLPGGFILKFGSTLGSYTEGTVSDTFDTPFPSKNWVTIPVAVNTGGSTTKDIWPQRQSLNPAGFTMIFQWDGGSTTNSIDGVDWVAIGN